MQEETYLRRQKDFYHLKLQNTVEITEGTNKQKYIPYLQIENPNTVKMSIPKEICKFNVICQNPIFLHKFLKMLKSIWNLKSESETAQLCPTL